MTGHHGIWSGRIQDDCVTTNLAELLEIAEATHGHRKSLVVRDHVSGDNETYYDSQHVSALV